MEKYYIFFVKGKSGFISFKCLVILVSKYLTNFSATERLDDILPSKFKYKITQ